MGRIGFSTAVVLANLALACACLVDTDCLSTQYCSYPNCVGQFHCFEQTGTVFPGKSSNGYICAGGNQCTSGVCVSNVCCNSACTGSCQQCSTVPRFCAGSFRASFVHPFFALIPGHMLRRYRQLRLGLPVCELPGQLPDLLHQRHGLRLYTLLLLQRVHT